MHRARGIGIAVIDSGVNAAHDDLWRSRPASAWCCSRTSPRRPRPACGPTRRPRRVRPRHARRRHPGRQRLPLQGAAPRHRARRPPRRAQGAGRRRPRLHQRRHRRHRLRRRQQEPRWASASSTCRWAPGVYESYDTDPLAQAAKRAVDAGIVVVASAGNLGQNAAARSAVRRHHVAGQRALGADGRSVEPPGHGGARQRRGGRLQLARADLAGLLGQARSRRARRRHRVADRPARARSTPNCRTTCSMAPAAIAVQALFEPHRHQHGRARGRRPRWP